VLDLESINLNAFTVENELKLEVLGSYVAIALENSRLYAESRDKELRLQRDLDLAQFGIDRLKGVLKNVPVAATSEEISGAGHGQI